MRKLFYIISIAAMVPLALVFMNIRPDNGVYRDDARYYNDISFSKAPGAYAGPFDLAITAPTDEIYYTLDGSEPDRGSIKYTGPVPIGDASADPNTYSMREDVSAFCDDEMRELYRQTHWAAANVSPEYRAPEQNIRKCTVIKAVYYDSDGNRGNTLTGSYFVGEGRGGYADRLKTVSLVMDPADLFDYERGIYVTGKIRDDFFAKINDENREEMLDSHWPANYSERGREWEREATLQMYDSRGCSLSQQVGVRIKGEGSREYYPKSFNLYARSEYDGNTVIHTEGKTRMCLEAMTLYFGGEDIYSKLRDPLMADICSDMGFATMTFRPCELFINGEYWGYCFLTEKYDEKYVERMYGVDDDNVVMIKNNYKSEGEPSDFDIYMNDMTFIADADMTVPENYERAKEILDMEGFIDYMAAEIYIARWSDWPTGNINQWRSRTYENGKYGDCRWRYMLFDVNWGGMMYDEGDATRDTIASTRLPSPVFDNLCNNPEFRDAFIARLMSMRENEFAPEHVAKKIDGYAAMMEGPMKEHYMRFFGTDDERFREEAEKLKLFFNERYEYIPVMIEANFPGYAMD